MNDEAVVRQHSSHEEFINRLQNEEGCRYVYTYPFKGAYRPCLSQEQVAASWQAGSGLLNIYIHIPYCEMKCSFCNLFTTTQHSQATFARYVEALLAEMRLISDLVDCSSYTIDSVYFGGGTPTLLPSGMLQTVVDELQLRFRFGPDAELAIESAPNAIGKLKLHELRHVGFQRLSIGVQSFTDTDLRAMHRDYSPELGRDTARAAIEAGFENVNIDLIYGLPDQSLETWAWNLESIANLGVHTVTLYPLVLRTRTHFGKSYQTSPQHFPRGQDLNRPYDLAVGFLSSRGYKQDTMATFSRGCGGSRHEFNEFRGIPTLGFGVAALSYAPTLHYSSGHYFEPKPAAEIIAAYFRDVDERVLPLRSGIVLDKNEARRRYVILGLLYSGICRESYTRTFHEAIEDSFGSELKILRQEGCIEEVGSKILPSQKGRRFSSVIADLLASDRVKMLAMAYA